MTLTETIASLETAKGIAQSAYAAYLTQKRPVSSKCARMRDEIVRAENALEQARWAAWHLAHSPAVQS